MDNKFDINISRPYKDFRGLCSFRSLNDRKMSWPVMEREVLDGKFILRPVREYELEEIVEVYRVGYPDVYGKYPSESVLWPDTLRELLGTGDDFMKGDRYLFVAEERNDNRLIGAILPSMDRGNMSVHGALAVIHPDHRGTKGLFRAMLTYMDDLFEKTGAEYGYNPVATFHTKTQIILKELGWKVRGVVPGYYLMWNYEDKYYRQPQVIMDKYYNGGEELVPKEIDLIMEAKKMYELSEEL